jgi:anthranilate synthase/aminodeoxychorismate synthase-like glutamine amidotransferase
MIVLIDNYDSFVYNLYQYLCMLGQEVLVFRNDKVTIKQIIDKKPKSVVISPGPCTPNEAGISVEIIKQLYKDIPILGVCLGHQSIGQAFGAKIIRAKNIMHGKTSKVTHDNKGVFEGIENPFTAMRYHSLVIEKESLPDELEISAESEDDKEIMGVRHKQYPIHGIQFHPESILTKAGMDILENFLKI